MKPQLFFIGQEVTPKYKPKRCKWVGGNQFELPFMPNIPQFGKIYRVTKYEPARDLSNEWYIKVTGFSVAFNESYFAPVIDDAVLVEDLESVSEKVYETKP